MYRDYFIFIIKLCRLFSLITKMYDYTVFMVIYGLSNINMLNHITHTHWLSFISCFSV